MKSFFIPISDIPILNSSVKVALTETYLPNITLALLLKGETLDKYVTELNNEIIADVNSHFVIYLSILVYSEKHSVTRILLENTEISNIEEGKNYYTIKASGLLKLKKGDSFPKVIVETHDSVILDRGSLVTISKF